ncbi:MAG: hypothetical protein M2R45_01871 [Verrucomicrobia subdivision 3 bacterium]|nr:hypothetical protein [Limisphaerales bacterium]MCS1415671.1 hypothetical protein [Limisphaerales bacterium]
MSETAKTYCGPGGLTVMKAPPPPSTLKEVLQLLQ